MRLSFFSTLAAFAIMAGQQAPKAVPLYNLDLNEPQHEPVWAAQTDKLELDKDKEKKLQEQAMSPVKTLTPKQIEEKVKVEVKKKEDEKKKVAKKAADKTKAKYKKKVEKELEAQQQLTQE